MKLVTIPDNIVNYDDRAIWITIPFNIVIRIITIPGHRIYTVTTDDRIYAIVSDERIIALNNDDRLFAPVYHDRTLLVSDHDRVYEVNSGN